jgi:hypothetical protein
MWDEIKVSIPPETSIDPLLKGIYEATVKITESDAKMAEAEWKGIGTVRMCPPLPIRSTMARCCWRCCSRSFLTRPAPIGGVRSQRASQACYADRASG